MNNLVLLILILSSATLMHGQPTFLKNEIDEGGFQFHRLSKLVDIDRDGDIDIISAEIDRLVWHQNDGYESFNENLIYGTESRDNYDVRSIETIDIDNDGYIDILAGSGSNSYPIHIFKNNGINSTFTKIDIDSNHRTKCLDVSDIDKDGDIDFIASSSDGELNWYQNNGDLNFTSFTIDNSSGAAFDAHIVDLNGNGNLDIVAYGQQNEITWYENDGSENFNNITLFTFDFAPYGDERLKLIDLDLDGDIDLITSSAANNTVSWFENDGSESFNQIIISTQVQKPRSFDVVDIDRDGDIDILTGEYDGGSEPIDKLILFQNDGTQNFIEHYVTTDLTQIRDITAKDVNDDGSIDILVTCQWGEYGVLLYENTTSTAFEPAWTENNFYEEIDAGISPVTVYSIDLDNDDDIDIIAGFHYGRFSWYENDGSENLTEHIIATDISDLYFSIGKDMDTDGDIDILFCNRRQIAIFENDGSENFTSVLVQSNLYNYERSVDAVDIDNDGDIDIIASNQDPADYGGEVLLFKNMGSIDTWIEYELSLDAQYSNIVDAVDMDNDGDMDILSGSEGKIVWFENSGNDFFENIIATGAGRAQGIHAIDIDGDGDFDVISSRLNSQELAWFENDGNENFDQHVIDDEGSIKRIYSEDIDNDGDIDIVGLPDHYPYYTNQLFWYENNGSADYFQKQIIATFPPPGRFVSAHLNDIDRDGDIDIIAGSSSGDLKKISWYENIPAPTASDLVFTINEDSDLNGTLSGSDEDGDAITYTIVTNTLNGTVSLISATEGTFSYSPELNYHGTDTFTYSVSDGINISPLANVIITINPINDAPEPQSGTVGCNEDEGRDDFLLPAGDVDGDDLTYSIELYPENGTLTLNPSEIPDVYPYYATFSYFPTPNYNGTDSFTWSVNDGTVDSEPATITINIYPVNDAPTVSNMALTIDEDEIYLGTLSGSDVEGDELTFNLMGGGLDKGTAEIINPTNGEFTYTPFENANGQDSFNFMVSDGQTDVGGVVTITINPINDAPEFPEMPDLVVDEDNTLAIQLLATDIDGDYLTYSVDPLENIDLYIYNNQNLDSLLMVPQSDWSGTANINLTADDGNGLSDQTSFTLTVNPVDDDPFVNNYLEDIYFYEDFQEPWVVNLDEIFTDIDGELTYTVIPSDPTVVGVEVSENMLHLFSLENANGATDLIVTASNPIRASISDTLLVTVFSENDPPIINPLDPISFDEDQTYELPTITSLIDNGTIVDIDNNLSELGFDIFSGNEQIYIEWDGDVLSNPQVIPDENYNGSGLISICVYDAEFSECINIAVTVNPVNDAPFFTSEMHATVGVGQEFHLDIGVEDIEEQELSLTLTEGEINPAWVTLTDLTMHGTPDVLGTFPVYLTLSDGEVDVLDTFHIHVENFMPTITSITDVPNDQGGRVYVSFNASFFDDGIDSDQLYSLFRYDVFNNDSSGWVLVEAGGAIGDPSYTYESTTLIDSISTTQFGLTEFKVVASMSGGIFHSDPMVGYSVDNIAPGVPGGLLAVAMDDNIQLSWDMNIEEDFQYYILEKSLNTDFSDFEVIELIDTSYTDMNFTANQTNYYRVTAVDYAGNHSETSPIVEATIMLSIDDHLTPVEFALHQNYPNPFNPTTQIRYDLPEDQIVNITIYDVMGRNIRTLMNGNQTAGYHSIHWDAKNDIGEGVAAGMYIYTIQAGEFRAMKKMVLLK